MSVCQAAPVLICLQQAKLINSARLRSLTCGCEMESLANIFDAVNRFLGVNGPKELLFSPVFLGACLVAFLYTLFTGMKYLAVLIGGLIGSAIIIHYLYPADPSQLGDLFTFVGAMGGLALLLVYLGFIRE